MEPTVAGGSDAGVVVTADVAADDEGRSDKV